MIIKKTTLACLVLVLVAVAAGIAMLRDIGAEDLDGLRQFDGFMSQLHHIQFLYSWADFEPLSQLNAHLIRWLIYFPMLHFPLHDYVYYALYATPISILLARRGMWPLIVILLVMPFGLSMRSGLAAIGLLSVYYAMFFRVKGGIVLTLGSLLCVFSSATLLQSAVFSSYMIYKRGLRAQEIPALLILVVFFLISANDKIMGALAEDPGYVDAGGSGNILMAYVMRSTIVFGLMHNDPRAYVYLGLLVMVLFYILRLLIRRGVIQGMRRVMLFTLLPGFLLEGLGVIAAFPILVWIFVPRYWATGSGPSRRGSLPPPPRPPGPAGEAGPPLAAGLGGK